MRNLGKATHATLAALLVAGVAACFSDPTSDLRNGPARVELSQSFIVQRVGEDDQVDVTVLDEQGNAMSFGQPTYTSLNTAVATVGPLPDSTLEAFPGNTLRKAIVRGVSGGMTQIVVEVDGLTDTVTVVVQPVAPGTVTVAASAFGPGTQLTLAAPAGAEFNTSGSVSTVGFGPAAATIISRTATEIVVISPAAYTGPVVIRNLTSVPSGLPIDSVTSGSITIAAASFPGTVTTGGDLLDTITISGGASASFTATGGSASTVSVGGQQAFILTRSASTITAIAKVGSAGPLTVTNVVVAGNTIPSLATASAVTISSTVTGESNEPGNQTSGGATALTIGAAAGDSVVVYGATNGGADQWDYFTFTMPRTGTISGRIDFFGTGSGADDNNPDIDLVICTTLSGTGSCSYGQDIIPSNGASSLSQPEQGTTPSVAAGTTVFARVIAFWGSANGVGTYRLRLRVN